VRLLLDTHTLLWYVLDDPQISANAKALIIDPSNDIHISPASYWEIAIKVSIGKLMLHQPYDDFMDICLKKYGFIILSIEPKHTSALTTMPFHHRDPFDRLLVAQVLVESIPLVSNEAALDSYGITRLW
jgi:PIN domain nuclease of toxin-antitoxin system